VCTCCAHHARVRRVGIDVIYQCTTKIKAKFSYNNNNNNNNNDDDDDNDNITTTTTTTTIIIIIIINTIA